MNTCVLFKFHRKLYSEVLSNKNPKQFIFFVESLKLKQKAFFNVLHFDSYCNLTKKIWGESLKEKEEGLNSRDEPGYQVNELPYPSPFNTSPILKRTTV